MHHILLSISQDQLEEAIEQAALYKVRQMLTVNWICWTDSSFILPEQEQVEALKSLAR